MTKKKVKKVKKAKAAVAGKSGNIGSSPRPGRAARWTAAEMAEAQPLPLPTVETGEPAAAGAPHFGTGETHFGGRPETAAEDDNGN